MKRYDFLTLGESLIDFTPAGISEHGFPQYSQNPGGAVLNAAAVMAVLGHRSTIISRIGNDLFGRFIKNQLDKVSVDSSNLIFDDEYNTTLAFVSLAENGERDFAFYRKNNADVKLSVEDIDEKLIKDTRIFHFGGLSLVNEAYANATLKAVKIAKENGCKISYDPNYRASLWDDEEKARIMMTIPLKYVDIIKISIEEAALLFGKRSIDDYFDILISYGISFASITCGEKGAYYATKDIRDYQSAFHVKTVDTTGAGDVYCGTILHFLLNNDFDLSDKGCLNDIVRKACRNAAESTTKKGGLPSIPPLSFLNDLN